MTSSDPSAPRRSWLASMASSRTLGTLFDGIARHTQEGLDFVDRSNEIGFREAVRERDDPFQDYGSRPRSRKGGESGNE